MVYDEMRVEKQQQNKCAEEEREIAEEFDKLQTELNNGIRQQVEMEFQQWMEN